MFKNLNEGISTPIAIAIILLLAVSVGGITLWQYSEMQKEKVELSDIKISENAVDEVNIKNKEEELEKAMKQCEGKTESSKTENLTTIVEVEELCYFIEAMKTENKLICEKIESVSGRCTCNASVDFLTGESKELKEEILGDTERPYYQLFSDIFNNPEIERYAQAECPIDIKELIEQCKELSYKNQQYCYFIYALNEEQKYICDNIEDECQKCLCRATVDVLKEKTEEQKKEIFQEDSILTTDRRIEAVMNNAEIQGALDKTCPCFQEEKEIDIYFSVLSSMRVIERAAKFIIIEDRSYSSLNCDHDDLLFLPSKKSACDYIQEDTGMKPVIHTTKDKYCVYVKLNYDTYFCMDNREGIRGQSLETKIDPSGSGYCTETTFICP